MWHSSKAVASSSGATTVTVTAGTSRVVSPALTRRLSNRTRRKLQVKGRKIIGWVGVIAAGVLLWEVTEKVKEFTKKENKQDNAVEKKKVVVLGSGFAALSFVTSMDPRKFEVTVVSPRSTFVFTPLLSACLVGEVDTQSIIEPLEWFRTRTNSSFHYLEAQAKDVDMDAHKVNCKSVTGGKSFEIDYDVLVIAVGGYQNTHNIKGVNRNCYFFNSLNDCRRLRNEIISTFEFCALPETTPEVKRQKLHFVIVGGGPVARKTADKLETFVKEMVSSIFPDLKDYAKVTLIEMNDHIHNSYDHAISNYFRRHYKLDNIITDRIVDVGPKVITLKNANGEKSTIEYGTCIWSTGTVAHPLAEKIASKLAEQNNSHALVVDGKLKVLGTNDVFAIGDCATIEQKNLLNIVQELSATDMIDLDTWKTKAYEISKQYPGIKEFNARAVQLFEEALRRKDSGSSSSTGPEGTELTKELEQVEVVVEQVLDSKITGEQLVKILKQLDNELTSFPSTASTAVQQGQYLAQNLSKALDAERAGEGDKFRYKHIGGFEYIGDEGVVDRGSKGKWILDGPGAWWLWSNVYYSYFVSMKMRVAVSTSWLITSVFGRKLIRY